MKVIEKQRYTKVMDIYRKKQRGIDKQADRQNGIIRMKYYLKIKITELHKNKYNLN